MFWLGPPAPKVLGEKHISNSVVTPFLFIFCDSLVPCRRYFRMDIAAIKLLLSVVKYFDEDKDAYAEFMDGLSSSFEAEFDYRLEAEYLTTCRDNTLKVPDFAAKVYIPKPISKLCTKKVLTMEAIEGVPIKKKLQTMMQQSALDQGRLVAEVKQQMEAEMGDPVKLKALMSGGATSHLAGTAYVVTARSLPDAHSTCFPCLWCSPQQQDPLTYVCTS